MAERVLCGGGFPAMRAALLLGCCLAACTSAPEVLTIVLPEAPPDARAVLVFLTVDSKQEVHALDASDPAPLFPSSRIDGRGTIELLYFSQSLSELFLEPGPVSSLPEGRGVVAVELSSLILRATFDGESVSDFQPAGASDFVRRFRVGKPCPQVVEGEIDASAFGAPLTLEDGRIASFEKGRVRFFDLSGDPIETEVVEHSGTFADAITQAGPDEFIGGFLDVYELNLRTGTSTTLTAVPDRIRDGESIEQVPSTVHSLDGSRDVLISTSAGQLIRYREGLELEVLGEAVIGGINTANTKAVTKDGRVLYGFSGTDNLIVYEDGEGYEVVVGGQLGTAGIGAVGVTEAFGPILMSKGDGSVLIEEQPGVWSELLRLDDPVEPVQVVGILEGFAIIGRRGELLYFSEATRLCGPYGLGFNTGAHAAVAKNALLLSAKQDTAGRIVRSLRFARLDD